jgi:hypothetical protein
LLEATRCGEVRPVPVKAIAQEILQAVHRVRTQLWSKAAGNTAAHSAPEQRT